MRVRVRVPFGDDHVGLVRVLVVPVVVAVTVLVALFVVKARPHEGGVMRLKTPPHHVPSVLAKAYSTAFRAAVEIAGGRNATMETRIVDATTIEYRGRWE